jgi:hypothetical protein
VWEISKIISVFFGILGFFVNFWEFSVIHLVYIRHLSSVGIFSIFFRIFLVIFRFFGIKISFCGNSKKDNSFQKRKFKKKQLLSCLCQPSKFPFLAIISFVGSHMTCLPNRQNFLFWQFFSGDFCLQSKFPTVT